MGKKFGTVLGLLGLPGDLDTFLKFIGISSGTGILSGYLQFQSGGSIAWMFMFALAGAAFTMVILYYYFLAKKLLSVFQRVSVKEVRILQAGMKGEPSAPILHHLTFQPVLRNHSDQIMYFKIRRALNVVNGVVRPGNSITGMVEVIQANAEQPFILATLPDILVVPGTAPSGTIELEILYGSSPDKLPYLFSYTGETAIQIYGDTEAKKADLKLTAMIREISHKKESWF